MVSLYIPQTPEVERLCRLGQMLLRGERGPSHLWAVMITGPHPLSDEVLNFFSAGPAVVGLPFVVNSLVEPFSVRVLV